MYFALLDDVIALHEVWYQYRVLFSESDEHIDVLNGAAPYLFGMIQDLMWKDVALHIARLMDPPSSGKGRDNLTLPALAEVISPPSLRGEVSALVDRAKVASHFAITWRHKRLAHSDRAHAMGTATAPDVTEEKVQAALVAVGGVLNAVSLHFWKTHTDFTPTVSSDARSLLHFLREGLKSQATRHVP